MKNGAKTEGEMSPFPSKPLALLPPELLAALEQAALPLWLLASVSAKTLMLFHSLAVAAGEGKCCAEPLDWGLRGHGVSAEEMVGEPG